MTMLDLSRKHDRATELRAIADGRLLLNVRNGVTVSRSMLAKIADEIDALRATVTPAEVGGLVQRLNGEADAFDRGSDETDPGTAALLREAATALAAKDAELAAVKENCETVCNSYADENQRLYDRAKRAEAQLAEANKALEEFADPGNWGLVGRFNPNSSNFDALSFARRAREQGGENAL